MYDVLYDYLSSSYSSNQPPNACFVTFDTTEAADDAVAKFNGAMVGSITLDVEIARKQKGSFRSRINYDKNNPEVSLTFHNVHVNLLHKHYTTVELKLGN